MLPQYYVTSLLCTSGQSNIRLPHDLSREEDAWKMTATINSYGRPANTTLSSIDLIVHLFSIAFVLRVYCIAFSLSGAREGSSSGCDNRRKPSNWTRGLISLSLRQYGHHWVGRPFMRFLLLQFSMTIYTYLATNGSKAVLRIRDARMSSGNPGEIENR